MNLYPALKASMGNWTYYIVKMTMRELATEVRFASEIYEDRTLDEAIQRVLKESRSKKEIAVYLARRQDRFFNSLVIAAMEGKPQFHPVRITDDEKFSIIKSQKLDESFGVLTFDGGQRYYALDGQHRLKAIKTLLDRDQSAGGKKESVKAPTGFEDEEVSVLMVLPRHEETIKEFLVSYRRLFSDLNRYAKPTDDLTNVIMDEDDAFAILTRRQVSEYDFFTWAGDDKKSPVVHTRSKNLKEGDSYFTTLWTLYKMNIELLSTPNRIALGWQAAVLTEFH